MLEKAQKNNLMGIQNTHAHFAYEFYEVQLSKQ